MDNTFDFILKLSKTNVTATLVRILNKPSIQKFITNLNTKVQLFDKGEDSEGKKLASIGGSYAPSTIKIKRIKRQPTNRVTLKDTGDFYKTFDVDVDSNANFSITSDTIKNTEDLRERYGNNITGLQDKNVAIVMERLEQEFYKELLR
jgi:hypothetical protein